MAGSVLFTWAQVDAYLGKKAKSDRRRACLQNFLPRAAGPDMEDLPAVGGQRHRAPIIPALTW